jgi:hypothetical protein
VIVNTTYLIAKRVRKLRVYNLAVVEDYGEAAARSWVGHVHSQTDCAHDSHGDDVESSSLDPLSKCRSAIPRWRAVRRHPRLFASEDTSLLFVVVGACRGGSVCCHRGRRAAVEETHSV